MTKNSLAQIKPISVTPLNYQDSFSGNLQTSQGPRTKGEGTNMQLEFCVICRKSHSTIATSQKSLCMCNSNENKMKKIEVVAAMQGNRNKANRTGR